MPKISLENNILIISDDSGFFYNDDYNSFFVDELGFKEEKNTRVFDGDINSELISNIYQYLQETNVDINSLLGLSVVNTLLIPNPPVGGLVYNASLIPTSTAYGGVSVYSGSRNRVHFAI